MHHGSIREQALTGVLSTPTELEGMSSIGSPLRAHIASAVDWMRCAEELCCPPSCVPWSNESDGTVLPLRRRVAEAASVVYGAFALPKPKYLRRDRPRHFLLVGVILL